MALRPLEGFVVGVTAHRRARDQAELLRHRGAEVVLGAVLGTRYLGPSEHVQGVTKQVIAEPPSHLVVTTGVGIRAWFDAAQSLGLGAPLLDALRSARVLARGPKAAAAAQAVGLRVWRVADDERMAGVEAVLAAERLDGARVVVQCFGDDRTPLDPFLASRRARVVPVQLYRWDRPGDMSPARSLVRAVVDLRVHAVTFTSAPAVHHTFRVADEIDAAYGLRRALNAHVVAACVGPVCAGAARELGIDSPVAPRVGRLGLMVRALSDRLRSSRRRATARGVDIELQGLVAVVDDTVVRLTHREAAVARALLERPGSVVSRGTVRRSAWGDQHVDDHAVTVTVARLRRKLGPFGAGIQTLPRRGYRVAVDEGATATALSRPTAPA